jgi:phosphate transport system substrate-binding protein
VVRLALAIALAVLAIAAFAFAANASAAPAAEQRGAPASSAAAVELRLSGATTMLPVVADLAFYYRRAVRRPPRFTITGGGTEAGIADTARGVADIGLVARALETADPPGLVLRRLADSAVCLVTNRANPLPGLDHAQVQDLVAGRTVTWKQVPGSPRTDPIAPIALAPVSGTRRVFDAVLVDPATPVVYRPRTFVTEAQVRTQLLAEPAGWGYVDLAATTGLHVVPLDGVPCTRATVRSGTYPARRVLAFATRGRPRGAAARFIRWARTSARARRIVSRRFVLP